MRLVRTQKFGKEAQIGNDMGNSFGSRAWQTPPAAHEPDPITQLRTPLIGSCLRLQKHDLLTTNLPNSWTLPTRSPGSVATTDTAVSSRTSRATRQFVLEPKTKRYAEYDPTPRRGDDAPWRVTGFRVLAQPSGGSHEGRPLAAPTHLILMRVNAQQWRTDVSEALLLATV